MFMPIVGHVNGQFLSEYLWLIFLIQVIPFVGLISGGLYLLRHWIGAQTAASAGGGPF